MVSDAVAGSAIIESAMLRHARGVLAFSGGKESVVLAHLLRPYRDKLELVWVNTGAMLPHMEEFVRGYGTEWRLKELRSNQPHRYATVGFPVRVVPIYNTPMGKQMSRDPKQRPMLTDNYSCCSDLRGRPITEYMLSEEGIDLLIHGQRRSDNHQGAYSCGAEVLAPLWDWSEAAVYEYIERHNLELPEQYPDYPDSTECWNCTSETDPRRFRFLAQRYPERMPALRGALSVVYGALYEQVNKLKAGLDVAFDIQPERKA